MLWDRPHTAGSPISGREIMIGRISKIGGACLLVAAFAFPARVVAAQVTSADASVDSYCSPTGDFCQSVSRKGSGDLDFKITTFSFRGSVDVCVRKRGRGRICQQRRLKPIGHGLFQASARLGRNWPNLGRGTYFVSWYSGGSRIGHILSFRR